MRLCLKGRGLNGYSVWGFFITERSGGPTADWLPSLLSSYSTQQLYFVPLRHTGKRTHFLHTELSQSPIDVLSEEVHDAKKKKTHDALCDDGRWSHYGSLLCAWADTFQDISGCEPLPFFVRSLRRQLTRGEVNSRSRECEELFSPVARAVRLPCKCFVNRGITQRKKKRMSTPVMRAQPFRAREGGEWVSPNPRPAKFLIASAGRHGTG